MVQPSASSGPLKFRKFSAYSVSCSVLSPSDFQSFSLVISFVFTLNLGALFIKPALELSGIIQKPCDRLVGSYPYCRWKAHLHEELVRQHSPAIVVNQQDHP